MMSNEGFRGVPGVPDGWELVEVRKVRYMENYIWTSGYSSLWQDSEESDFVVPIIRKIEQPAKYRAFANAEEFKPHRDRWWRFNDTPEGLIFPYAPYNDRGPSGCTWQQAFNGRVCDDGTPFGVKIDE
jgi:hypothetical protein